MDHVYQTPTPLSGRAKIILALGLAGLVVAVALLDKSDDRLRAQEQERVRQNFEIIDEVKQYLADTNNSSFDLSQALLDRAGIKYQLKTNEVLRFNPSMADNWQGVYINTKALNTGQNEPEYTRGVTTVSNLQNFIKSGVQ